MLRLTRFLLPEISGGGGATAVDVLTYKAGWINEQPEWVKPKDQWNETQDVVVTGSDWPEVNWPPLEEGQDGTKNTGQGDWGEYHLGHGGFCNDISPPFGYWW